MGSLDPVTSDPSTHSDHRTTAPSARSDQTASVSTASASDTSARTATGTEWWRDAVIYQV